MRGDERTVLRALGILEVADAEAISRKVALSLSYVEEICDYLAESGYLTRIGRGKYQLSTKGERYNPSKYIPTPRRASRFRD